jgi:hypothetical protein
MMDDNIYFRIKTSNTINEQNLEIFVKDKKNTSNYELVKL